MTQQQILQSATEVWQQVQTQTPVYWSELVRLTRANTMATGVIATILMIFGCLVIRRMTHDGLRIGSALWLVFFFAAGITGMVLIH